MYPPAQAKSSAVHGCARFEAQKRSAQTAVLGALQGSGAVSVRHFFILGGAITYTMGSGD